LQEAGRYDLPSKQETTMSYTYEQIYAAASASVNKVTIHLKDGEYSVVTSKGSMVVEGRFASRLMRELGLDFVRE
jgi:hypothetical protein